MVRHTEYCKQAAAGVRSEANIETCAPAAAPKANRMQSAVFHGWLLEACARVFSICFSTYVGLLRRQQQPLWLRIQVHTILDFALLS